MEKERRRIFTRDDKSSQNVRRKIFLSAQHDRRRDSVALARLAVAAVTQSQPESTEAPVLETPADSPASAPGIVVSRKKPPFLTFPEWLLEIPQDFVTSWVAMARPSGTRCLVVARRGHTIAKSREGRLLKGQGWQSALPGGGQDGSGVDCILDCYYVAAQDCFVVIDLLCWNGTYFYDCTAEMRWWMLAQKLAEAEASTLSLSNPFPFLPPVTVPCGEPAQLAAICGHASTPLQLPYAQDGVLFYHREAHYELGTTPLVLVWRDACCCPFYADSLQVHRNTSPVFPFVFLGCVDTPVGVCGDGGDGDRPDCLVDSGG
ncbi:putative plant/F13M23-20 protein [Paratrimastix pyriformis]|uniref:Snurportin-1 n=1 Tax=Paratrimastix pyriformis TaxID=342808 RepID=A0ABQ8UVZ2_9EUKA|nr:putative plant/F13M23-20 protein [Paratrimastix pyriformis]